MTNFAWNPSDPLRVISVLITSAGTTLVTSQHARAQSETIEYVSQARWVEATGWEPYAKETKTAAPFEPFDASVEAGGLHVGKAQQTSTIDGTMIHASGWGQGVHYINAMGATGWSRVNIVFVLKKPTAMYLHGKLVDFTGSGSAWITLSGPGMDWYHSHGEHPLNNGRRSVLGPGAYTLEVVGAGIGGSAWMPYSHGLYDITLEVVCLADCDDTGTLNIDDFICFQTLFVMSDLLADCDGNGELAIDDFLCFQTAFAIGC